jgi:nitrogen-specific signal transduction histidine kinase/CheY-like chemotaxis protein
VDEHGNLVEILSIGNDNTQKKNLEAQLLQAQKMEAIGTLAGGIAHDINNLLMGIQGNASLMLLDIDTAHPHYDSLKNIEKYVQSGAGLTKQLLGFARGGKYEVRATNLNELLKKSSEMFARTNKELTLHRKYQEDIWSVDVDQGQIEQVLLNLYVNAWQAMPGGGNLYVETQNVTLDETYVKPFDAKPGKYVKISVTDTGVGMDKATQERIFEPFFTTKEMGRGTGLGLASAYGIIKNHGGMINVYSEKGEGTAFHIYLPASEKDALEEENSEQPVPRGTETILFVDDEDMILDVGRELLKRMGYRVLVAQCGKEAIEFYQENKSEIDMVILDMVMPEMSGGATFDKLREINPALKVLLASGYSVDGQAARILKRGCDGFIQKPFNVKELSQRIRQVLKK